MVSTVTAIHGTSNTSWRSSRQGEMLEEREKKSRKQQK